MEQIKWIEPGQTRSSADVSVRIEQSGKTAFTFRNGCELKITHGDKIIVGLGANRIYFKEAYEKGYKLTQTKNTRRVVIRASCKNMVGDYRLRFDARQEVFFIEKGSE